MPFTPFHLGPALLIKAAAPHHFSLGVFTVVQVALDLEVAWNLAAAGPALHDRAHTLFGAVIVSLACLVPAKLGLSALCRWLRQRLAPERAAARRIVAELQEVTWLSAITGALLGAVTHVLLDALVHPDVRLLAPWLGEGALWFSGSFQWVHLLCLVSGLLGLALWQRPRAAGR